MWMRRRQVAALLASHRRPWHLCHPCPHPLPRRRHRRPTTQPEGRYLHWRRRQVLERAWGQQRLQLTQLRPHLRQPRCRATAAAWLAAAKGPSRRQWTLCRHRYPLLVAWPRQSRCRSRHRHHQHQHPVRVRNQGPPCPLHRWRHALLRRLARSHSLRRAAKVPAPAPGEHQPHDSNCGRPCEVYAGRPCEVCAGRPSEVCAGRPCEVCAGRPYEVCAGRPCAVCAGLPCVAWCGCPCEAWTDGASPLPRLPRCRPPRVFARVSRPEPPARDGVHR